MKEELDFSYFNSIDDDEVQQRMIRLLYDEAHALSKNITKYVEEKDATAIANYCHKISSKFSILQMPESYALGKEIERNARENIIEEEKIFQFKKILQYTAQRLEDRLNTI